MRNLTQKEINRQDFVDNAVFDMIKLLNPSGKQIQWNIEFIANVRDSVEALFVERTGVCNKQKFYSSIKIK